MAPSSAPGSNPDGLAFTAWQSSNPSNSPLTVDLGSDQSFQRVTLKQASVLSLNLVTTQKSEDGVNFTNVPGGISLLGSVGTLKFAPVTARFVRVNILNLFGSGDGLEEMAVFPE